MAFGLVNASFSLPEMQAVKNDFLCTLAGIKCNSPMIVSGRSLSQFALGNRLFQCGIKLIFFRVFVPFLFLWKSGGQCLRAFVYVSPEQIIAW